MCMGMCSHTSLHVLSRSHMMHPRSLTLRSTPTLPARSAAVLTQPSAALAARDAPPRGGFGFATFATGIVYGLQPDALFVIIPALALPTKLAAAAYILMFVVGTVAAMGAYAGVIGATSAAIKKNNSGVTKTLGGAASAVAIAIGLVVLSGGWGVPLVLPWGGGH
jgi:hypothetical protein